MLLLLRSRLPLLLRSRLVLLLLRSRLPLLRLRCCLVLLLLRCRLPLLRLRSRLPLLRLRSRLPLLLLLYIPIGCLERRWSPHVAIGRKRLVDGHIGRTAMIRIGKLGPVGARSTLILHL